MAVGGGDDGAVGEEFDTGIGAIRSLGVVHETHPVLTLAIVQNVFVSSHPGDPITFGGGFVGGVAKGDEESAVRRVDSCVSIAGKCRRKFARGGPGFCFVVAEDNV